MPPVALAFWIASPRPRQGLAPLAQRAFVPECPGPGADRFPGRLQVAPPILPVPRRRLAPLPEGVSVPEGRYGRLLLPGGRLALRPATALAHLVCRKAARG